MEKVLKITIRYTCEDYKDCKDLPRLLYRMEYETISFNKEEIIKFLDGLTEYMNENFGKYWQLSSSHNIIEIAILNPGFTYDGETFVGNFNPVIQARYGATWVGGIYNSIEDFKNNLDYIKELYNVYLDNYKKYKEEN